MKGNKSIRGSTEWEKRFLNDFHKLCNRHHSWQVWQDFVEMSACAIANAVDHRKDIWQMRENSYMATVKKYTKEELNLLCDLLTVTTMALDTNPAQDFLGKLYMNMDFGSNWHGQFFTPWHVAELMAKIQMGDNIKEQIESQRYITVGDTCCGAGCMLMAFANACRDKDVNVNYQQSVLFVGQDIDPVVAKMCYIQISLLGCPGYVVIGNSLTEPVGGTALEPQYNKPENIWFTPIYFTDIWEVRRIIARVDTTTEKPAESEKEPEEKVSIQKAPTPPKKPTIKKSKPFSWKDFFTVKKRGENK